MQGKLNSSFYFDLFREIFSKTEKVQGSLESKVIDAFLFGNSFTENLIEHWHITPPVNLLFMEKNWRRLLFFNLLVELFQLPYTLTSQYSRLLQVACDSTSPSIRMLVALNGAFLKLPLSEPLWAQVESGAWVLPPPDLSQPWLSTPRFPFNDEISLWGTLLALQFDNRSFIQNGLKSGEWRLLTLDAKGIPIYSLFTQHTHYTRNHQLIISEMFFRSISYLPGGNGYMNISQAQQQEILALESHQKVSEDLEFVSMLLAIERWLSLIPQKDPTYQRIKLSEWVKDERVGLIGFRDKRGYLVGVVSGDHTGLGTVKQGNVEIVAFGPQHIPRSLITFGIEAPLNPESTPISIQHHSKRSLKLRRDLRMVDRSFLEFEGIWLETEVIVSPECLELEVNFLSLRPINSICFTFYVKGEKGEYIPGEGAVFYDAVGRGIEIIGMGNFRHPEIYSLFGDEKGWGASHLLIYPLSEQKSYRWMLKRS